MNDHKNTSDDVFEIDLKRLLSALLHKAWIIAIAAVVGAVIAFSATKYFVTPLYTSSAMFYVNNSSLSLGDTSVSISNSDITASKNLVNTYAIILKTRTCLNAVIDYANLNYSYGQLKGMISASSVNETEIFQVTVTSPDPAEAERIANAIAYILPKQITDIVEGTSAKVVDHAVISASPASPSYTQKAFLGFMVGFAIAAAAIVIYTLYDVTVRTEKDIEQCANEPILAAVPNLYAKSKDGYYAKDSSKRGRKKYSKSTGGNKTEIVGSEISFAASEAYKLLRTKLLFSFVSDNKCPVVAVSSAMAGEGKSLTSVNLAYSLAQLNKRVLLVDCDMRRPSLCNKLPIRKDPGLSNYLTGQNELPIVIQECRVDKDGCFDVIASGGTPPNPIELLSSAKMAHTISEMKLHYDYIILDLPPVGEVSDAMATAQLADGILMIVRQDYGNTVALSHALSQFRFVGSRILGIVMNCTSETPANSQYKYGKKYHKKYYSSHRYEQASTPEWKQNPSDNQK